MTTFRFNISPRRKAQLRLLGDVHTQIGNAVDEERKSHGLTRRQIAETLGWDKGALTKKLRSSANVTLETLADLGFALNREVLVFFVRPEHAWAVQRSTERACQIWTGADDPADTARTDGAIDLLRDVASGPCARVAMAVEPQQPAQAVSGAGVWREVRQNHSPTLARVFVGKSGSELTYADG